MAQMVDKPMKKDTRREKTVRLTPEQLTDFDAVLAARQLAGAKITQQDAFVLDILF